MKLSLKKRDLLFLNCFQTPTPKVAVMSLTVQHQQQMNEEEEEEGDRCVTIKTRYLLRLEAKGM